MKVVLSALQGIALNNPLLKSPDNGFQLTLEKTMFQSKASCFALGFPSSYLCGEQLLGDERRLNRLHYFR